MSRLEHLRGLLGRYVAGDEVEAGHHRRMLELAGAEGVGGGSDGPLADPPRRTARCGGTEEDPFSRSRFVPGHFTASSFILSPDGRSVLLIHHRKLGRWLQPGGHVEEGDADVVAASRREALEETGLGGLSGPVLAVNLNPARRVVAGYSIPSIFDVDIHAIPAHGGEPAHEHFDVRFLYVSGTEGLRAGEGVRAARWVGLEELMGGGGTSDGMGGVADESVMRAVRKVLAGGALAGRRGGA